MMPTSSWCQSDVSWPDSQAKPTLVVQDEIFNLNREELAHF